MSRSVEREQEFDALFVALYPRLAGWAARLSDLETGRDVANEAFTRLLVRWDSVDEPKAWLYMTAGNLLRDQWRRGGRERLALVRMRPTTEQHYEADPADRTTVRELVETLPDRMRLPVLMYYYADLPIAEIAAVTEKSEGTIKRALFDARAIMARSLKEMA